MDVSYRSRQLCQSALSRLRALFYGGMGMRFEGRYWLGAIEWPARPRCITVGDGAALDHGITLLATNDAARIVLGPKSYINRRTIIDASELVEIGAHAMIGPFCYITDHDHTFQRDAAPGDGPLVGAPTRIGARCWIGAHVTVLKGVIIGEGSVVGAGSVVTKSLPPHIVAVGNPARVLRGNRGEIMSLRVSIAIPTHNRRDDLARTLGQIAQLDPQPDEILVLADGCSDGTQAFVRSLHPHVRLLVHEMARGCVVGRNVLAAAAHGDVILGLDDDSHPIESDFIARLRELFLRRPRLAVASFPQRTDEFPASLTKEDFGVSCFTGSFVNCAAAFRRSVFLELGGYPEFFFQAYDEPDFALRCLNAGWEVFHETGLTVRHHFTPVQRNEMRTHQRHARNELWSVLLRCPAPQLFGVALFRIARQFGYAWKRGLRWAAGEPRWWLAALRGVPQCARARRPVPWRTYLSWMRLVRRPIAAEEEWRKQFGKV